jgi:hypothetical protein
MIDAKRLRARAELCLQMARHITDRFVSSALHRRAADYLARAMDLEHQSETIQKMQ